MGVFFVDFWLKMGYYAGGSWVITRKQLREESPNTRVAVTPRVVGVANGDQG